MKQKDFEKQSIFLFILLTFITFGTYPLYWIFTYQDAFNKLNSKVKISKISIIFIALTVIAFWLLFILYLYTNSLQKQQTLETFLDYNNLASAIAYIYIAFRMKTILVDHFKIKMSGITTFFFSLFYIQYKINRIIETQANPPAPTSNNSTPPSNIQTSL